MTRAPHRFILPLLVLLAAASPVVPQGRLPGPDPAREKVIRPGKLIGPPKDAAPEGGKEDPAKPGGAVDPGKPGKPADPAGPGGGVPGTGGPNGTPRPPAPLSVGEGLRIVRWVAFRRITRFHQADLKHIGPVRLSADGTRIAFAAAQGTFVINADGSGLTRLSDRSNLNPGVVDISADGRKVVWTDIDQREMYVASSDGTARVKLPVATHVSSARITADGRRVFLLSPEAGGILSIAADGTDRRMLATTAAVCRLNGVGENGNHWRGWPSGLDIAADGSRVVFHLLWDAFAMNGDGSGVRQLTQYLKPEDRNLNFVRISGDGKRVATYHQVNGVTVTDWDGTNTVSTPRDNVVDGRWMELSADGGRIAASWGLWLFDGQKPGKVELHEWGSGNFDHPLFEARGASISADGRRVCLVVKYLGLQQLVVVDINPPDIQGLPALSDLTLLPRSISTDGSIEATATARVIGGAPETIGVTGLREGSRFAEWHLRPWGALNDGGRAGDRLAGDGVFSTAGLRLYNATGKPPQPGPITIRFFAWDRDRQALLVDVEGFQARLR